MIIYKNCDQVENKLIYETFKVGFSDYIVPFNMTLEEFIKRFFEVDRNDRAYSYIALDNNVGIGLVLGGINTFDGLKSMRCGALCISPEYRGKGAAQELIRLHKQKAEEENCNQMILEVIVGNERAIRFYEKNNYIKKYDWYIYSTENLSFLEGIKKENIKPITIEELKNYRHTNVDYHIAWSNEIFCIEKRDASHYAVIEDEKMVGVISMQGGTILFLHVLKEYRGKGYGKALIKKALKEDVKNINMFFSAQTDLEKFLESNNFSKGKIEQFEMSMKL